MPVHQPRQVSPGEGALLPRQRLQRQLRLGQQPLAVAPGDGPVFVGPLGIFAPHGAPRAGRPDLVLRLQVDAARRVRT